MGKRYDGLLATGQSGIQTLFWERGGVQGALNGAANYVN